MFFLNVHLDENYSVMYNTGCDKTYVRLSRTSKNLFRTSKSFTSLVVQAHFWLPAVSTSFLDKHFWVLDNQILSDDYPTDKWLTKFFSCTDNAFHSYTINKLVN